MWRQGAFCRKQMSCEVKPRKERSFPSCMSCGKQRGPTSRKPSRTRSPSASSSAGEQKHLALHQFICPKEPDFEFLQTAKPIFKAVVPVPDEELVLHQLQSPNPELEDSSLGRPDQTLLLAGVRGSPSVTGCG